MSPDRDDLLIALNENVIALNRSIGVIEGEVSALVAGLQNFTKEARDANDNQWEKISAIETGAIERDAERSKVCSNHRIKQAAKSVGLGGLSGAGMIGILELLKVYFQGHWVG